jgi:GNAT superfamily N-acetyltransferase
MPVVVEVAATPLSPALETELGHIFTDYPAFTSADIALTVLRAAVAEGDTLYTAFFNNRYIAAVLVRGEGETRHMRYLCVHNATRGRGVAERLIAEMRRYELVRGTKWLEADFDLAQEGVPELLLALGFIPHGAGNGAGSYRYSL